MKPGDDCTDDDSNVCDQLLTNMKCKNGKCICQESRVWVESKKKCFQSEWASIWNTQHGIFTAVCIILG